MRLILNLLLQTLVSFGLIGAVIFAAAGTTDYPGGWIYIAVMIAVSLIVGRRLAREDPGLLRERLKGPLQKGQPLADKLLLIPILLFFLAALAFMAADAMRWRWSHVSPAGETFGAALLIAASFFSYWTMRTNSFAAPVVKIQTERAQTVITTGPYAYVRHPFYTGGIVYLAGTSLTLGSLWGLVAVPIFAVLLGVRIGIEEKALRTGLAGYDDYAARVRWRLVPFVW